MRVARIICVAAVALSCDGHVFVCESSSECVDGTVQGMCEANHYCSFPDPSCPAQRRFADLSAPEVAGQCIDAVNSVVNGTCDLDTSSWIPYRSIISLSTDARTGPHSCRVCDDGFLDFTMDDETASVAAAVPGQVYVGHAWVRDAPGTPTPTSVYLQTRTSTTNDAETSSFIVVNGAWQELVVMQTVKTTTQPFEIFAAAKTDTASPSPCFLIDDITLYRLP